VEPDHARLEGQWRESMGDGGVETTCKPSAGLEAKDMNVTERWCNSRLQRAQSKGKCLYYLARLLTGY